MSNFSVLLDKEHQILQLTRYRIRDDYFLSLSAGKSLLTPCTYLNALLCFTPVDGVSSEVLRFPHGSVVFVICENAGRNKFVDYFIFNSELEKQSES
jgi:hypothetical protein